MAEPSFDRTLNVIVRERVDGYGRAARALPPITRSARVVVSDAGVAIDDEAFVRRGDLAQAYFQPRRDGRGSVRCVDASGKIILDTLVHNDSEGAELLRALNRDVAQSRASFLVTSPLMTVKRAELLTVPLFFFFSIALLVLVLKAPIGLPFLAAAFLALTTAAVVGRRIEVGVDGVLVRWFGRGRLVGYDRITSVQAVGVEVHLGLVGGQTLAWTPSTSVGEHALIEREMTRDALIARIEDARALFARRADAADIAARVTRGSRAIAEWRTSLEQLGSVQEGAYRDSATRTEDLWRVVEDAGAPAEARAGAAVALRKEEGASPRLRIAADAVAAPKLRVALEAAADPEADEAALEEALEAVTKRS